MLVFTNPVFVEGSKSSQGLKGRLDTFLEDINTNGSYILRKIHLAQEILVLVGAWKVIKK